MAPETHTTACPHCGKTYASNTRICPDDGSVIEHASTLDSQVGVVLDGKYRLDSFLSKGGMGAVYRATHVMLGKTIAVKLIRPELVTSPEIVRRFQREARAATALNHPNIVGVSDLGQTSDGTLYIAMEFIDGPSLKDMIEHGHGVEPGRAIALLQQVASALSMAHRNGIIHRDLKPHNIMLARTEDGRDVVKLVDFGIAKTFNEATQLTSTGVPIGTPHYMPPEQATGTAVDGRSDLYSVGIILFEMLTGEVPFDGSFTPAILFKHISEPPVAPSVRKPGAVPPVLDEIVLRLLQKDPADRYQTADELADALDEAALTIPPPEVASPMPRKATRPAGAVYSTPVQSAAASSADPTVAQTRMSEPLIQGTPVQRVSPSAVAPTMLTPKPTARPPAAAAAAEGPGPVAPSPTLAATLPPPAAIPAAAKSSNSSAPVLIAFLVAGIIATVGAAYYFNSRGSSVSTEVATNNAPASNAPATEPAASPSPQASTPTTTPPSAAPPASSPSVPSEPPANPGATTQGAAAAAKTLETASKPAPPLTPPSAGSPPSPRVPTGAPPPPARGVAPSPQGQPAATQPARGSALAVPPAPPAGAAGAPATQAPGAAAQASAAVAARREVPAAQAATFPEKPAVFFRCTGPAEVCNPLRTAVDEALGGAGLTIVRRANAADIDVEAQVEVLQQNVDRQFGTTFAVRTYSIAVNGETTKTGEVVSMPSVDNLSFDQRVGSERANERARLVAAGVVERVKAFAVAKSAR